MPDPVLQRKCAKCDEDGEQVLQTKELPGQVPVTWDQNVPPIVHEVLRSPGQPLDAETRAFMEPRFGHDFSRVRMHTDSRAAESARDVNSRAYTAGNDMFFSGNRYEPNTADDRRYSIFEYS